jgi:hypothetical protein
MQKLPHKSLWREPLFFLVCIAAFAVGCKRFPSPFEGERVLARAGKETLRQMDLERVVPVTITGADSVKWVENYVNRWVRDKLKLQAAEQLFGDNAADEELVRAYRGSLITRRLDDYFIARTAGDSLYSQSDLKEYYDRHKADFVLDRTIVKGRVVAFPSSFRQKTRLRELFGSWRGDEPAEVLAMARKSAFTLGDVGEWTEYQQFLSLLPTLRNETYDNFLTRPGVVQEMVDGNTTYWFVISEKRTVGETRPYEMVSELVRQTVATRRRSEIVKAAEDSLFNVALTEKKAVINL